jgi:hypothetical protein
MAAHIVCLDRPGAVPEGAGLRAGLPQEAPDRGALRPDQPAGVHGEAPVQDWRGASGRAYRHTVYSLIECPPLPMAVYVLVRRDERGQRRALRVGVAGSEAPTLNLARVRRQGAQGGAGEVHVYAEAGSDSERSLVAYDLRAGLFGTLAATGGDGAVA